MFWLYLRSANEEFNNRFDPPTLVKYAIVIFAIRIKFINYASNCYNGSL